MKRFFIVFYKGFNADKGYDSGGDISLETDGCFINYNYITSYLKDKYSITNAVVTNILEVNEADYKYWINSQQIL